MRKLIVVQAILMALVVAGDADEQLITTWRGRTYQGVMPARNLVDHFCWYDTDGPDLAAKIPDPRKAAKSSLFARQLYAAMSGGAWPRPGTKSNACWRAPLPAWGASSVVCVGDKAFVTCEAVPATDCQYTLVCVDVPTGNLDWVKPIDHLLAMPKGRSAKLAEIRRAEVEGWAETMRLWNKIYWDNEKDTWYGTDSRDAWKDRLKGGRPGELSPQRKALLEKAKEDGYTGMSPDGYWGNTGRYRHPERLEEYRKAWQTRAYVHCHNKDWPWYGSTCASPVGDGTAVYAVAAPDAVVCYELDGTLRWAADMRVGARPSGFFTGIHRHMASPVIAEGKLVYFSNTGRCVFAWDCATGALAWKSDLPQVAEPKSARDWWTPKIPRNYNGHMGPGGTPVAMALKDTRIGQDVTVVIIANGDVLRAADGEHLGWFDASGDVVYATAAYVGDVYLGKNGAAHRLRLEDGKLVAKPLWHRVDDKRRRLVGHKSYISLIGTPSGFVTTDGLWDVASGKTLRDKLGGLPGHKYVAGCVSLDGQYIWRSVEIGNDAITFGVSKLDGGTTSLGLIVEGQHPEAARQAAIDRFGMSRIHMGWCHPTAFGNRIFVRTGAYMYCFGKGEWKPVGRSE